MSALHSRPSFRNCFARCLTQINAAPAPLLSCNHDVLCAPEGFTTFYLGGLHECWSHQSATKGPPAQNSVGAADLLNGSKDDAKSRDLGSRRWAAVAAAVVAASSVVVRIPARVDLTRPG